MLDLRREIRLRLNVQLGLPLIQVAVAGGLLVQFVAPPPGYIDYQKTAYLICCALNGPAFLLADIPLQIRHLLFGWDLFYETAIRLCFVWLVWYAVAIEYEGSGQSVLTSKIRPRGVVDALAVMLGVAVGLGANRGSTRPAFFIIMNLVWAAVIIGFYGHDLWITIRRSRR